MRLKKVTSNDAPVRLSASVRKSVLTTLEQYQQYYLETYGDPIKQAQLLEEVLRAFFKEDKDFQKYLAAGIKSPSSPV